MSMPAYARYKASGVDWIGQIPHHWKLDRLKWSATAVRNGVWGEDAKNDDDDIACVRVADFDRRALRAALKNPTIRNVTASERKGRTLAKGDLLLEKSGGGDISPVGCVVLFDDDQPAICSNFIARVSLAPDMNPSFWRYVHAAAYAVGSTRNRSIKLPVFKTLINTAILANLLFIRLRTNSAR